MNWRLSDGDNPVVGPVFGEVVVLATPAIRAADDLSGKVVIDCTNPVKPDFSGLALGFSTSGAE